MMDAEEYTPPNLRQEAEVSIPISLCTRCTMRLNSSVIIPGMLCEQQETHREVAWQRYVSAYARSTKLVVLECIFLRAVRNTRYRRPGQWHQDGACML
eukprot:1086537-Rhodomonas_salina.2